MPQAAAVCRRSGVETESQAVEQFQPGTAFSLASVGFIEAVACQLDDSCLERLGREREGLLLGVFEPRGLGFSPVEQVERGPGPEAGCRHAQARVAERIGGLAAMRRAEEDAEAAAGVDRAAPAVGELDALELGEGGEEVL